MNKKFITFGLLSLLAVGIASALIVNYMSEKASVDVPVTYAMDVQFAKITSDSFPLTRDGDWGTGFSLDSTTQLSTTLAGIKLVNNADVPIENKVLELVVSNDLNDVSCEDITSLMFLDTATQTQLAKGFQELSSLCQDKGESVVYNIPINSLASKTTYEYPAKVTFGVVEPTTYHFNAQMLVVPATA